MKFQEFLESNKACQDFRVWAQGKTIEQAIDQCHRGDWLSWLAIELGIEKRLIVGVSGRCANTVRHLMGHEASRNCVDVCIRYGNGEATDEELEKATAAATTAFWASSSDAARAAVWAAARDAAAEAAADAAEDAAEAALAWAAALGVALDAAAAAAEAREQNQRQTADICREHLKKAIIEKWNQNQTP